MRPWAARNRLSWPVNSVYKWRPAANIGPKMKSCPWDIINAGRSANRSFD